MQGWHRDGQYLQEVDECQVFGGDVVVVVLDGTKSPLVVPYQLADLGVLPLLQLMDLRLPPQVQLVPQCLHLPGVLGLHLWGKLSELGKNWLKLGRKSDQNGEGRKKHPKLREYSPKPCGLGPAGTGREKQPELEGILD